MAKIHQWFNLPYRLHCSSAGKGSAIIFLHGIATSSKSWSNLTPLLESNFKCITIDLIGFGDSPKPAWYSYTPQEHVRNIDYTIKKLGLREPFILVGHSMGGLLAAHYTATHPGKVKELYLLSPPVYLNKKEARTARKLWRDELYGWAYKYFRTHKKFTLKGSRGLKVLALRKNPFLITENTWLSFTKSLEECIEKQNVVGDLEQIHCPIDVFYGTLDQLLIKKNIKALQNFKNVQIKPVRVGHMVNLRYGSRVAQKILTDKH